MLRALLLALGTSLILPALASAHGLSGKQDLPIPSWLVIWGGAVVLVVSFVALGVGWTRPIWQWSRPKTLFPAPDRLFIIGRLVGLLFALVVVMVGLVGTQEPEDNLAPTLLYVAIWVGIPIISAVVGNVWAVVDPVRGIGWLIDRFAPNRRIHPWSTRLGWWPAAVGLTALGWIELVLPDRDKPCVVAVVVTIYLLLGALGRWRWGEEWSRSGDPFAVYVRIIAHLAPLERVDGRLRLRWPLVGLERVMIPAGGVTLVCAMIGITSFDGFAGGTLWTGWFASTNTPVRTLCGTGGLLVSIGLIRLFYGLGCRVGRVREARFAHALVPIALAYTVAHYWSFFVYQVQRLASLISDPLGVGWDLIGTADVRVDYAVLGSLTVWYVQVAALVIGHVCGLMVAHERSLIESGSFRDALRSQYPLLAVMILFTSLGLWILSAAN